MLEKTFCLLSLHICNVCTVNWGPYLDEIWNGNKYLLKEMDAELRQKDLSEWNFLVAGKSTACKAFAINAADSGLIPSMQGNCEHCWVVTQMSTPQFFLCDLNFFSFYNRSLLPFVPWKFPFLQLYFVTLTGKVWNYWNTRFCH